MKKIFLLFLFSAICFFSKAQNDSCHLRISLLTCSPGNELYSTFGHSALRVIDSANHSDIIFNYGTFDFNDPDFYWKFTKGKLLYFVSIDNFSDFLNEYQYEGRGITEQTLDLSCPQKQELVAALFENAKEENKYYKYDFTYDNCTTRLRDMVMKYCNDSLMAKNIRPYNGATFRNLIHEYLDNGGHYWSKLGIDILLGMPLDKKISNNEAMFLPDYLMKGFDSTSLNEKSLVKEKNNILRSTLQFSKNILFSPIIIFSLLFFVGLILTLFRTRRKYLFYFDFFLYFLSGVLGIVLLFMWLGTDHQACRYNLNLIWALPTNFIIAFFINKKWGWLKKYFLIVTILLFLLMIMGWKLQQLNPALIPVMALLLLRSLMLYKRI